MNDEAASEIRMDSRLSVVLFAFGFYNAYVSRRVAGDDVLSFAQKKAQILFIWLLPLAGAILVHWISVAQSRQRDDPSRKYASYEDYQEHDKSPNIYDDP